ncbi:hypothetical protein [Salinigranum sp. GCM10025319]|uniref:hypothetical protein n=1 Tax=Salinigranum sp. GCM10025319 TaxID=3252687 RepID=UPI00360FCF38
MRRDRQRRSRRRQDLRTTDRLTFTPADQARSMSDKDLLALVLGGVALLMFATGIILAV